MSHHGHSGGEAHHRSEVSNHGDGGPDASPSRGSDCSSALHHEAYNHTSSQQTDRHHHSHNYLPLLELEPAATPFVRYEADPNSKDAPGQGIIRYSFKAQPER
jgi:hypothetical protein